MYSGNRISDATDSNQGRVDFKPNLTFPSKTKPPRRIRSAVVNSGSGDLPHQYDTEPVSPIKPIDAKRVIDFTIAGVLVIPASIIICSAWLSVKLTSKGPGIFWSERVGLNGTTFSMPKIRSMEVGSKLISREIAGDTDVKVTTVGRYLRKTSIDELPQLWSVLRGDMSLIGPRALIVDDIAGPARSVYPEIYSVRPGISGLAQIKGRNNVHPRHKARYDVFYVKSANLRIDLWLILKTIKVILNTKIIS